ncbi:hypothetical protein BWQ27_08435 [Salmonella enterica subsp. enterica serovar Pensacola]|uniref:Uncharacterized protein n=1 Tax=Salmonella enterica subsp. enterica serovar Pensacola TaxID=34042 RepID=A0A602YYI0_SALET|nr:hypothetical protein [Salmonella enterica subsp. enterica serovar Pensacola]
MFTFSLKNEILSARQGKARQGKARQGKARQGKARQGKAVESGQPLLRKSIYTESGISSTGSFCLIFPVSLFTSLIPLPLAYPQ